MARPVNDVPTLEFRPGWGWRARIRGVQFRLGGVNTAEADAKIALARLVIRVATNPGLARVRPVNATLADLIEAFLWSDESPRGKQHRQKYGQLVDLFDSAFGGDVSAMDYDADRHREFKAWLIGSGRYKRWSINDFLCRVRRLMKFGRSRRYCDANHVAEVCDVPGVRHGDADESTKVEAVSVRDVERTIPHLPAELRPLVRIQLLCGARAGELLPLRSSQICRKTIPWSYAPAQHKSKWRGDYRVIYFGPRARVILQGLFDSIDADDYLFSPQRSRPGCNWERQPGPHYTRHSYSHAIQDACRKAGVTPWTSHQLRHRCGTDVRQAMGYDAAQAVLGHAGKSVTDRYSWSETSCRLAKEAMERLG
jgi:integrase